MLIILCKILKCKTNQNPQKKPPDNRKPGSKPGRPGWVGGSVHKLADVVAADVRGALLT
jgi:hypothetical protein